MRVASLSSAWVRDDGEGSLVGFEKAIVPTGRWGCEIGWVEVRRVAMFCVYCAFEGVMKPASLCFYSGKEAYEVVMTRS